MGIYLSTSYNFLGKKVTQTTPAIDHKIRGGWVKILVHYHEQTKGSKNVSDVSDLDCSGYSESVYSITNTEYVPNKMLQDSLTDKEIDEIENLICEYFQGE